MPFVWAVLGAIVTAYIGERACVQVVRGTLLASFIPMALDPALAWAYAQSTGISRDPQMLAMLQRLLGEVRSEMAAGRIKFSLRSNDDNSGFTVPLLSAHPAAAAGATYLPYAYGIARPFTG